MPALPTARDRAGGTARASAIAVVFVANGLGGPSFLPRVPERQVDLGLSDAGLGLVLAGMAVGALAASPTAGRAVGRFGSRPIVLTGALALAASLWTAGAAPSPALLFAALALVGAADATMDIAMNANGAAYERGGTGSVMHRLHGAWSLGALAGAGIAAGAAGLGIPLTWQLAAIGAVVAVAVVASRSGLVTGDVSVTGDAAPAAPAGATGAPAVSARAGGAVGIAAPGETAAITARASGTPAGAAPPGNVRGATVRRRRRAGGALVVLALATVGGALVEGAPADWSALRLERMGTGPGVAALGLAAFMAGMLTGRLVGDPLTDRYGGARVLRGGMALVAVGLVAGALVDHPAVFALGLVLAGAGSSGFFPLAFSAAGDTAGVAPGAGAATVSLAARLGFLVEPLAVGAVAEVLGLRLTFALVALVAGALAAAAARIVPASARLGPAPVTDVRA